MLKIYNSLTDKKEIFKPRKDKQVDMFVCGITPYDSPHIGNFRVAINYDVMARYLRFRGYKVFYLQNITDIDDKIIKASREKNMPWQKIAEHYFKEHLEVSKQLNIKSISKYAKATKHIKEIIAQIETLMKKGYTYEKNGSVYFEVGKFKDYGKLSHQNLAKLHKSARLEEDKNKKHPYDFVLWKTVKQDEPSWNSPWGLGRPGWHIEDTAITEGFFGAQYDIHGGATELKFPHHEAEIAQAESSSGKKPFVKYWPHAGLLMMNGEKMSKSLGNFITGKEMIEKHGADNFRFMIISSHYRSIINYTENSIAQAKINLGKIRNGADMIKGIKNKTGKDISVEKFEEKFVQAMDDDFNTPAAISAIFEMINYFNRFQQKNKITAKSAKKALAFLKKAENILGVSLIGAKTRKIPEHIIKLAQEREKMRQENNWAGADKIREQIRLEGYIIKDLGDGFEITK